MESLGVLAVLCENACSMNEVYKNLLVELEFTPNPNTLKYSTSVDLLPEKGAMNFVSLSAAQGRSPLAEALFDLHGIVGVMVGKTFVTVTIADQDNLTALNDQIISTIKNFLMKGLVAVNPSAFAEQKQPATSGGDLGVIEQKIIKILDDEIRPAVAMDGGDITFAKFEDGMVYLHMKGSCAGCPSSTATLKMGIENRLKDAIPEVVEVVAV